MNTQTLPSTKAVMAALPAHVQAKVRDATPPLKYSEAIKLLQECRTIDGTKLWADKADALAAWAKVYKDDQAFLEARRIKLHAYRQMGQIAEELRPTDSPTVGPGRKITNPKGARSLLIENGLSPTTAGVVLRVSRTNNKEFEKAVERGVGTVQAGEQARGRGINTHKNPSSDDWLWLSHGTQGPRLTHTISALGKKSASAVARGIKPGEVKAARLLTTRLMEWLDEFEQALPKEPK